MPSFREDLRASINNIAEAYMAATDDQTKELYREMYGTLTQQLAEMTGKAPVNHIGEMNRLAHQAISETRKQ